MNISYIVSAIVGAFLTLLGIFMLFIRTYQIYAAFVIALGLFMLVFYGRHLLGGIKSSLTERGSKFAISKVIVSLFGFGILIMLNVISHQYHYRVDTTKDSRFSLSDQTHKVLNSLKGKLRFVVFEKKGSLTLEDAKNLLRQYSYIKRDIKLRFLDVDGNPDIAKKYGVKLQGSMVLIRGDRKQKITSINEKSITNALLKLMRTEKKNIYFLEGHGEKSIDDIERYGLTKAKEALEEQNFAVHSLSFASSKSVPGDCSVLVIAGSEKEYLEEEIKRIDAYMKTGGKCLLLLDPPPAAGFSKYLNKEWGIVSGNNIIVDKVGKLMGGNEMTIIVTAYGKHEITEDFRFFTYFPFTRSVTVDKKSHPEIEYYSLAQTTPDSWAETDYKKEIYEYTEGKDIKGPVNLIAGAKKEIKNNTTDKSAKKKQAEIIVVGDSDFIGNNNISIAQMGNKDFFLNIMNYLADEGNLISIRPKNKDAGEFAITADQAGLVWLIVIIILPGVWVIKGIIEWVKRRRM